MRNIIIYVIFALVCIRCYSVDIYDVRLLGAVNDGTTLNTFVIQSAIDSCSNNGGGIVLLSGGGKYMSGTLYLKDHVTLRIEKGTTLLGSPDIHDYTRDTYKNMYKGEPHMDYCFIYAEGKQHLSIEGDGIIDGNGFRTHFTNETVRPMLIRLKDCKDIRLKDITLNNAAAWTSAWLYCEDVFVSGVKINSRANWNGDGLDFDGCRNVVVSNCIFDTSDDSICLQASRKDKACSNVSITNCVMSSQWAAIRIGLLSVGDIHSVTVSNCTFKNIKDSGFKIQQNESGEMRNMIFSDIVMENVPRPIFMTFCKQRACVDSPDELPELTRMHGFIFSNMIVDNSKGDENSGIVMTGIPGYCIEDIILKDILFTVGGGGVKAQTAPKEMTPDVLNGWWPEYNLFGGTLPSYGIFARHIKGLTITNVQVKTVEKEQRDKYFFEDVLDLKLDE